MLEGNIFVVFDYIHKKDHDGFKKGYCAIAEKIPRAYNLAGYIKENENVKIASCNVCKSWKEAQQIADSWNECYCNSGNYAMR